MFISESPNLKRHIPVGVRFMIRTFIRFAKDEDGATAIEYGLIAALVSVACIAALDAVGGSLTGIFDMVSSELGTAAAGG